MITAKRIKWGAASLCLLILGFAFWFSLPDPLFRDPLSTILLSRDQQLLGARIATDEQWRFPEIEQVPDKFKTALLQFEDKRFYSHPGVDPLALVRAAYLNLKHGRIVSGGSTLNMQVIRLARKHRPRTYLEKLIEGVLAFRLDLGYDKDRVLALYASHAPFGGNVVGLEAAAWRYFGRGPERLSWAESSLLAVLPNSPAMIHPGKNRALLKAKRDDLLLRLHEADKISEMELQLAKIEPLPDRPLALPRLAPHLLATLMKTSESGRHRFESTLEKAVQIAAREIVNQHGRQLALQEIHNVAALIVDNRSSEVVAYIGNSNTTGDSNHGKMAGAANQRGRAVDIIQRPRSTGSTLKPLLFAAMLQAGEILPTTLVSDVPTQYAGYMPENFDRSYRGAVPARDALARSLNVPAVRMLYQHGIDRFYDFLEHLGMSTLFRQPAGYGLTLVLGGAEGTLWDITSMYSNLAVLAGEPAVARDTTYRLIKVTKQQPVRSDRRVDLGSAAAWMTLQALLEVNRPGEEGHWRNFGSSQKIAWKTGTSFGLRDAWAIGVTPGYTVGVWVGNASGEGRPELTGLTAAAPVMFDLFNRLQPSGWFAKPWPSMKEVEVCRNDGYLANGSCETERLWIPKDSHFDRISPYNTRVHLDKRGDWRVHSRCEDVFNMKHESWFTLPPAQEFYYRRAHSDYRSLPDYRPDCRDYIAAIATVDHKGPIDLLYPNAGSRVYIPIDLGQVKSRVVFEAVHRDPEATLFWHLNNTYLGETRYFHQQALDIKAGKHRLVLVDQKGDRLTRHFEVLTKQQ